MKISKKVLKNLLFRSCKISFNSWLSMSRSFKTNEVKLELLTDIDMLLLVEKGIKRGICRAIHQYAIANNKYIENYVKKKESYYLKYCNVNNFYGLAMLQKLSVNKFK